VFVHRLWPVALGLFLMAGFSSSSVTPSKASPGIFLRLAFLLLGTRWWAAKVRGRV